MYLTRSPIGLVGTTLAGTSGFLIVTLILWEAIGERQHPYLGIITYMVLPVFFILGLTLIVVGIRRQRRRIAAQLESGEIRLAEFPVIDLNDDRTRAWLMSAGAFGATAAVILAMATAKGVEYVDSNAFCGETCHVMQPEYTAYQRSPHARVHCVECHVGSGTRFFLKAKVSGVRQVVRLWTDTYERPIPTPVHDLRPASATCEHCHWPTKYVGDRTQVINKFRSDSANTPLLSVLLVHVGGQTKSRTDPTRVEKKFGRWCFVGRMDRSRDGSTRQPAHPDPPSMTKSCGRRIVVRDKQSRKVGRGARWTASTVTTVLLTSIGLRSRRWTRRCCAKESPPIFHSSAARDCGF
jgi:hypothetical protein